MQAEGSDGHGGAPPLGEEKPSEEEWERIRMLLTWTGRECEVVRLLAEGSSRRSAAGDLHISTSTVQTHLQRALWKSGCDDLVTLIWRIVALRDDFRRPRGAGREKDRL